MNNLYQKSYHLLKSIKCRDICKQCIASHERCTQMIISRPLNVWSPRSSPQLVSLKIFANYNQPKRCLWTTLSRNQRLAQVYRNATKDSVGKTSKEVPKADQLSEWQQMKQLSLTKKLKYMFVKYWYISIPVHCVTSLVWFGTCYIIAKRLVLMSPIFVD